jgi:uncharacterized protein YbjT (DUF2867 family)
MGKRLPAYQSHQARGLRRVTLLVPEACAMGLSSIYPQPIGGVGVTMIDIRDIADAVVAELLRRERAPHSLPRTTIELVGPDTLTGAGIAAIWASVLGSDVRYGGDDLAAFESLAAGMMPAGWRTIFV